MRNFEATKREVLVSIVIVLVLLSLGFLIGNAIHNNASEENEKYFKALKVNNDPAMFNHAINTEIGNMVSYGVFTANDPVSNEMIKGNYFAIRKVEEHYVMKTRVVTYTDSEGNTKTKTETYWEWDEVKREHFATESFTYLDKEFSYGFIPINHYSHKETVKDGFLSDVRFKFYTIPKEFNGTLYSKAVDKKITDNRLYLHDTIESLIEKKEKSADTQVVVFWIIWSMLIIAAVVGFIALDNRYLNNK